MSSFESPFLDVLLLEYYLTYYVWRGITLDSYGSFGSQVIFREACMLDRKKVLNT